MIADEVVALIEEFASQVTKLPGVSRTNPHAFAEAKSELAGAMIAKAKQLRTVPRAPGKPVGAIALGVRMIGKREVAVVTRRRV